ncbi:MAG: damage-inducible protein DinB [Rhodospirillales bacterium]|nr:damage-inducible protein DinB [Rhodospirillales bacterium]
MHAYFATLAHYNAWANSRLFKACLALTETDYRAQCGAFFGSIHGTLNHILVADRTWMARLAGGDAGIPRLDTILHDDREALWQARRAEDAAIIAFIESLAPARLNDVLKYRTLREEPQQTPLPLVLGHLFNHATHHRGQVHGLLSQVPVDPPPLDLLYFSRGEPA